MAINCNACPVEEYCGTMVSCIRLCRSVHPEYFQDEGKEEDNEKDV